MGCPMGRERQDASHTAKSCFVWLRSAWSFWRRSGFCRIAVGPGGCRSLVSRGLDGSTGTARDISEISGALRCEKTEGNSNAGPRRGSFVAANKRGRTKMPNQSGTKNTNGRGASISDDALDQLFRKARSLVAVTSFLPQTCEGAGQGSYRSNVGLMARQRSLTFSRNHLDCSSR